MTVFAQISDGLAEVPRSGPSHPPGETTAGKRPAERTAAPHQRPLHVAAVAQVGKVRPPADSLLRAAVGLTCHRDADLQLA
jgi:hypothetical protein